MANIVLQLFQKGKIFLILVILAALIFGAIKERGNLANLTKKPSQSLSFNFNPVTSPIPTSGDVEGLATTPTPEPTDSPQNLTVPTTDPALFGGDTASISPVPTDTPAPTSVPVANTSSSSSGGCSGTPTGDNSEVYVNSSHSSVTASPGSIVTFTVNLEDCNNSNTSSDHISITLSSGASDVTVNGNGLSVGSTYKAQAQNGQYTFQVSSQTVATDVFNIQDTDHNFSITMPNYMAPAVTFSNNSSGNPNCTTAGGVPNSWYSDVYGTHTTTTVGSNVTISVTIRDCSKNTANVSDTLDISMINSDSTTRVNGQALPISIETTQGQASFTFTSGTVGTDTFTVKDTTHSFNITDTSDNNPSLTFNSASAIPTPTTAPTTPTPVGISPTNTTTPTSSSSATPTQGSTST